MFITYKPNGRLGNNLFQYMTCKLLELTNEHRYIDYISFLEKQLPSTVYTEDMFTSNVRILPQTHIICDGYFQRSKSFVEHREILKTNIMESSDIFVHKLNDYADVVINGSNFRRYEIRTLFETKSTAFDPEDLIISVRLDDFIQMPCPTSDIINPSYYIQLLQSIPHKRAYLVCDEQRQGWEHAYIRRIEAAVPTLVRLPVADIHTDFSRLRAAPKLLHSNSTFSWLAGFFGTATKRWIPRTHMYRGQELLAIGLDDVVQSVKPMSHAAVFALPSQSYIHPFSYGIPDELICDTVPPKTETWASIVPGNASTYTFGPGQESEYYKSYQMARFANTRKKGGWDALRHYEILANGSLPVFDGLELCPESSLTTFPKQILKEALPLLLPWTSSDEQVLLYDQTVTSLLQHTRTRLSCSSLATAFLHIMRLCPDTASVLIIPCDPEPNYSREMLTIGLSRLLGPRCTIYPSVPFLSKDFPPDQLASLHGQGYTYTRRLDPEPPVRAEDILLGLQSKRWSAVLYAKIGPDEFQTGTVPHVPFWSTVQQSYTRDQIAFLYGGDECFDLSINSRYSEHLNRHKELGHCFVRELKF